MGRIEWNRSTANSRRPGNMTLRGLPLGRFRCSSMKISLLCGSPGYYGGTTVSWTGKTRRSPGPGTRRMRRKMASTELRTRRPGRERRRLPGAPGIAPQQFSAPSAFHHISGHRRTTGHPGRSRQSLTMSEDFVMSNKGGRNRHSLDMQSRPRSQTVMFTCLVIRYGPDRSISVCP